MARKSPKTFHVYTDGGARGNPGPAAIGVMVCDENDEALYEHSDYIGEATNNIAEYCALIAGLELAKRLGGAHVQACMDSELVCRQVSGMYRIKAPDLKKLYATVKEQEAGFASVRYKHLPRTHPSIREVDRLVNRKLDEQL